MLRDSVARFKGDFLYSFASVLASIVAIIGNVVAACYLTPEEMGVMQTLSLIPVYTAFLHLGVFNGLSRNTAIHLGRSEQSRVQSLVDSSWRLVRLLSGVLLVLCVVFSFALYLAKGWTLYTWGMLFIVVTVVCEPASTHLEVVYLSTKSFARLGIRILWQNAATLLVSLLPVFAGVAGFIIGRAVTSIVRLAVRWGGVPVKVRGPGSLAEMKTLAIVGMPLLVTGTIYSFLGVADRSVVASFLSPREVGNYTLASLVILGTQFLPLCLGALMYPRVASEYGRTNSSRALRRHFWVLLGLNVLLLVPISLLAFFLIEPLTMTFMPAYADGISAARLAALSSITLAYYSLTTIIAVLRRNKLFIIAIGLSLGGVWGLGSWLVTEGHGLTGVVVARTVASAFLCAFTIFYAYNLTGKDLAVENCKDDQLDGAGYN
ncbi:MAG: lipopolysaccharide biosynthesis protein [Nibricoccus sp.]